METKYYVRVEVRQMEDDKVIGSGTCNLTDLTRNAIAEAAKNAGMYASGKALHEFDLEQIKALTETLESNE